MLEKFLLSDPACIMLNKLTPKDIGTLIKIFCKKKEKGKTEKIEKKLRLAYKENVGNGIDGKFREIFGNNYLKFKDEMIRNNGILSGSFILQVALGEFCNFSHKKIDSDIDIYVKVTPEHVDGRWDWREENRKGYTFVNQTHKFKFKLGYTSLHNFLYKICDDHQYMSHSQYNDDMGEFTVLRVTRYYINSYTIEIIEVNDDVSYKQLFDDRVDFNICKNFFRYTHNDFIPLHYQVCIKHMDEIIEKKTKFNYTQSEKKSLERYKKYKNRGFIFVFPKSAMNKIK